MTRHIISEGVMALHLPAGVFDGMAAAARQKRVQGTGNFCYMPVSLIIGMQRHDLVVALVDKPVRQDNLVANPGDVIFQLQKDWNVTENQLDDSASEGGAA